MGQSSRCLVEWPSQRQAQAALPNPRPLPRQCGFWKIGPQKTLYVPGPWLKQGANEVVVFEMDGKPGSTLEGLTKANLGQ